MLGETSVLIKCQVSDHSGLQFLQCKYVLNVVVCALLFYLLCNTEISGARY